MKEQVEFTMQQADYILCECELEPLESFIRAMEMHYTVQMVRHPSICTIMIRAEDSVEGQSFYAREALVTECELALNGQPGFGLCLGDEPSRSYCIAFADALLLLADHRSTLIQSFLREQDDLIARHLQKEYNQVQRTKVDFKLMEQD